MTRMEYCMATNNTRAVSVSCVRGPAIRHHLHSSAAAHTYMLLQILRRLTLVDYPRACKRSASSPKAHRHSLTASLLGRDFVQNYRVFFPLPSFLPLRLCPSIAAAPSVVPLPAAAAVIGLLAPRPALRRRRRRPCRQYRNVAGNPFHLEEGLAFIHRARGGIGVRNKVRKRPPSGG